jgi:hypothetical protein
VSWLRRAISVVLILGLVLGTAGRAAAPGMRAGMHGMSAAMNHDGMPGCDGCINSEETGKRMPMAGCQGGICVVLPGLLPSSTAHIAAASDIFVRATPAIPRGLSRPPDHPPPIAASLM